jgi:hypothetical protein
LRPTGDWSSTSEALQYSFAKPDIHSRNNTPWPMP